VNAFLRLAEEQGLQGCKRISRLSRACSRKRKILTPCTSQRRILARGDVDRGNAQEEERAVPEPMTRTIGGRIAWRRCQRDGRRGSITVTSFDAETQTIAEVDQGGAIGTVREVHNWSSRPFWAQAMLPAGAGRADTERPRLGPVAGARGGAAIHHAYLPFVWRGWYDFGCGSFGDMGCYSFAGMFRSLTDAAGSGRATFEREF